MTEEHENQEKEESATAEVDKACMAVSRCVTKSQEHRKVVSHIFGRNKTQTRQIPETCFIEYCRKHYQRLKFRGGSNGTWIFVQIGLVHKQLDRMERWGGVTSWNIVLHREQLNRIQTEGAVPARQAERDGQMAMRTRSRSRIDSLQRDDDTSRNINDNTSGKVDDNTSRNIDSSSQDQGGNSEAQINGDNDSKPETVVDRERTLLQYTGDQKSFADVRFVLHVVTTLAKMTDPKDKKGRSFPKLEFLPNIDPVRYPPQAQLDTDEPTTRTGTTRTGTTGTGTTRTGTTRTGTTRTGTTRTGTTRTGTTQTPTAQTPTTNARTTIRPTSTARTLTPAYAPAPASAPASAYTPTPASAHTRFYESDYRLAPILTVPPYAPVLPPLHPWMEFLPDQTPAPPTAYMLDEFRSGNSGFFHRFHSPPFVTPPGPDPPSNSATSSSSSDSPPHPPPHPPPPPPPPPPLPPRPRNSFGRREPRGAR